MDYLESSLTCYWQINQKNGNIVLYQKHDVLIIIYSDINGTKETFKLSLEHFDKMVSYKTIYHALNYARKHKLAETEQTLSESESNCPSHSEATNVVERDTLSTPAEIEQTLSEGVEEPSNSIYSKQNIIDIDFPIIWFSDKPNDDEIHCFLLTNKQQILAENALEFAISELKEYIFCNIRELSEKEIKSTVSNIIKYNQLLSDLGDYDPDTYWLIDELKGYGVPSSCLEGIA